MMTTTISSLSKPEEIELLKSFGRSRSTVHTSKGNATVIALPFVCMVCMGSKVLVDMYAPNDPSANSRTLYDLQILQKLL